MPSPTQRPEIAAAKSNLAPPDLVPEHQRHAGEPDQRAAGRRGAEWLAEEQHGDSLCW